jgi:hypothetical protein
MKTFYRFIVIAAFGIGIAFFIGHKAHSVNMSHHVRQTSCLERGVEVAISNDCTNGAGACIDNSCPYGTSENQQ